MRVFTPSHMTEDWIAAAFSPPDQRPPQMRQALQISDLLIWCLDAGLCVGQVMTLVSLGLYNEPAGAYLSSVLY